MCFQKNFKGTPDAEPLRLRILDLGRAAEINQDVRKFLELEPDIEARWQGLTYLENEDPVEAAKAVEGFLDSDDRNLAATAAAWLLHRGEGKLSGAEQRFRVYIEWAAGSDSTTRATAARLIGFTPSEDSTRSALSRFLRDNNGEVIRAALLSAANVKPTQEVPIILAALGDRRQRRAARGNPKPELKKVCNWFARLLWFHTTERAWP